MGFGFRFGSLELLQHFGDGEAVSSVKNSVTEPVRTGRFHENPPIQL